MKEVMVVAGEASGDIHGGNLVKALSNKSSELRFYGMGGECLKKAGCDILFEAEKVSVVGVLEIVSHLSDIIKAQKTLRQKLKTSSPSLLVIIDFPDFNMILARYAKKLGIPIFYYITPQVWAWRSGRVKTIKKLVDRVGVILPFEEQFFLERGVSAKYVGHPLLDSVKPQADKNSYKTRHKIKEKMVGLIPGSRKKEISSLLPDFLKAATVLAEKSSEILCFMIPKASTISKEYLLECGLKEFINAGHKVELIEADRHDAMKACDAVVAASGTVTLELAILDVPMVVCYRTAPITYRLGRLLIDIEYFSLVNLIAGAPVVLELLQDEVQGEKIADELYELLFNSKKRQLVQDDLKKVRSLLGSQGASERAAEVALELLG